MTAEIQVVESIFIFLIENKLKMSIKSDCL